MFTTTRFDGWDLPQDLLDGLSEAGLNMRPQFRRTPSRLLASARPDRSGPYGLREDHRLRLPVLESATPTGTLPHPRTNGELAQQVMEELGSPEHVAFAALSVRWNGPEKQAKLLDDGVDVIIGTPGRVMDMADRGHIDRRRPCSCSTKRTACWARGSSRTSCGSSSE